MNDNILTTVSTIDVAGLCFDAVIDVMPDVEPFGFDEALQAVRAVVSTDLYFDLERAINALRCDALEAGFRAGWLMRGRA